MDEINTTVENVKDETITRLYEGAETPKRNEEGVAIVSEDWE